MASDNLKDFIQGLDYPVEWAEILHNGTFTSVAELRAAERNDLVELNIPKGAAGRILQEAKGPGVPVAALPTVPIIRENVAQLIRRKLLSPSSYAKNNSEGGWSDSNLENVRKHVHTHRPSHKDGELPVALYDPILGQVEEDCAYGVPAAADFVFATTLMQSMSGSFSSERERMERFWALAMEEFQLPLEAHAIATATGSSTTDGSAVVAARGLGVNLEVKLDVGTGGGDPRIQNCAYAALFSSSETGLKPQVRAVCRCPTLCLELAGPNLSASGFVFGASACSDQLSHMVCLCFQPKSELMIGAARIVFAIRKAWPAIKAFYEDLDLSRGPGGLQLEFPYPRVYAPSTGNGAFGGEVGFDYSGRVSVYTFSGTDALGHDIIIKFCKTYSTAAHLAAERLGAAPTLYGFNKLPGCWLMVVMAHLRDAAEWGDAMEKPVQDLLGKVQALHDEGYVHGDLRPNNVLVQGEQAILIDFEWAGLEGEAKYPGFMNHVDIEWPDGASDLKEIKKEHDLHWVNLLTRV